ncbi:hypothetical protein HPB47_022908 [Ixodes persulcatus]|uniref:Uncharacterized protein n=1 Tax=Ixodes persulcatus TaxID=34615 RepID=A0AC60Q9J9_IXOPE|nr:hypothetical protein HPB47_022908 [Ixodes persulcatus]
MHSLLPNFIDFSCRLPPLGIGRSLVRTTLLGKGPLHDAGALCSPNTSDGNYLMYARATVGTLANNRKFSPCSISNISAVLRSMFWGHGDKRNCFLASQGPFCGNKIREGTEECDCGFMESQCRDSCCFANKNKNNAQGCTLRPGTQCRTGNVPKAPPAGRECPEQTKRPDLTVCNQNTQVCIRGHCVGSICLKYGFLDCQVSGANYSQEDMCRIHCRTNDTGSSCLDPCTIAALKPLCKKVMERGAACNHNLGYCDVYHRCRPVEEEGTLSKLEALLNAGSWLPWVRDNVWLAATFTVFMIAAVLLMVRYCALLVPSSNPALPRAKSVIQMFRSPSQIPAPRLFHSRWTASQSSFGDAL